LEGVRESRINRDEPLPEEGAVVPPAGLPADALGVWHRLAPDLITKRVLTAWDVDTFALFCRSTAIYNRAAAELDADPGVTTEGQRTTVVKPQFRVMQQAAQTMMAAGARFGLTPADRAALKVDRGEKPTMGAERLIT
jgi:P27 family predicted phage terminase small subunit